MTITRRAALRAAGMGAVAAWSASCTARPGSPAPAPGPAPSSPAPAVPPDWNALRARLSGGLVVPGDAGYEAARRPFNLLFDARKPAAVAACARPEDVQACVETARRARLPIAARSGGHSYAGYSTPDGGLVADLSRMSGVRVQPDGTAEIAAGTKLIDVYAGIAKAGRCLPGGSCPSVGIAGLTLGGGIGVLMRKFGLTCDRLVSARIVTADGTLRTASAESEPDLFWALRGGGGGNLGIVTSFTFTTEPAPDLTVFSLRFPAGATAGVLGAWQQWIATAPDELWSNCVISAGRPPTCRVGGCYIGSPGPLNALLDSLLAKTSARLDSRSVQPKGFLDAMRYFAACSQRTVEQCRPQPSGGQLAREGYVATSHLLPRAADPTRLVSTVDGRTGVDLLLDSFGGTVSRIAPDATAFPHRTALASAQIYATATPATRDQVARSVTDVRTALAGITSESAYVNYIDPTMPNWPTAYYGDNAPRLRGIATKYDPDAIFTFPSHCTRPPERRQDTCSCS